VQWVNPAAFAQPTAGAFGNLARNKYYGPGYGSMDFSVYKPWGIVLRPNNDYLCGGPSSESLFRVSFTHLV